jgi:hypothetical protein
MSSVEELKKKALERRKKKQKVDESSSTLSDVARAAGQGLTFGFGDELVAIAKSLGEKTYEEALAEEREALERFREGSPQYAYPIEIAASIPTSLLGVGLLGRGAQAAGRLIPSAVKSAPAAASSAAQAAGKIVPYGARPAVSRAAQAAGKAIPSPTIAKATGAAAAEGALYGAGAAEEGERLSGAGVGGALGGVLGGAVGASFPKVSEQAKKLISEGVPVTAGQAMGGVPRLAETAMGAIPVVREFVQQAKDRATAGFTSAVMNRALKPLGEELPKKLEGTQAFDETMDLISKEYEKVIPSLNVGSAEEMAKAVQTGISEATEVQPTLYGKDLKEFSDLVGNIFSKMPKSGNVDGKVLKEIESRLGAAARTKLKSGRPDTAFALNDVKAAFRKELARQDKTGSEALSRVNEAYKNILPIEKSVNKALAEGGNFTPKQLMQSMRQQSPRQTARGQMTDQDFAMAAQEVIGKKSGEGAIAAPLTGLAVGQQTLSGNMLPFYQLLATGALAAPMYSWLTIWRWRRGAVSCSSDKRFGCWWTFRTGINYG